MQIFDFTDYGLLLQLVLPSLLVALVLGVLGGLLSTVVIHRDSSFAVHGISELSFAGAAVFLLVGLDVVLGAAIGSMLAALVIGTSSIRSRNRNSMTAVLMPFGLGVGILALSLYPGRASSKFSLLTGSIVSIGDSKAITLLVISVLILITLLITWRRMLFASVDPQVAQARGVNLRLQSVLFMVLLGLAIAVCIQVVGALLVLSLLVTPAAAAMRVTSSQFVGPLLAVLFAVTAAVGGMLLSLGSSLPVSPFITTVSFVIYVVFFLIQKLNQRTVNA
jgi:zinc/manganese transport system permease protein